MDPASILGLASSIYTFIEAGSKAVRQYRDFRRNGLYETRENAERRIIIKQLKTVSEELVTDGPPLLAALGKECKAQCDELLILLERLTIKNPHSGGERIKVMVKAWWRTSDISSMEDKLNKFRKQFHVDFLKTIRCDNVTLMTVQYRCTLSLSLPIDTVPSKVTMLTQTLIRDEQLKFNKNLENLNHQLSQLRVSQSSQLAKLRSDLQKAMQMYKDDSILLTSDQLGSLLLQHHDILSFLGATVQILRELRFDEIYDREDTIKPPTKGTFILGQAISDNNDDDDEEPGRRINELEMLITPWLRSESGIFHISGKAGSGKSTLMKHIVSHPRIREHVEAWAGEKEILYAAFFFWAAGNNEQKSLKGLRRSILYTVLSQETSLIREVFPQCWENGQFNPYSLTNVTRPAAIDTAFETMLHKTTSGKYRICLFIDGLDEYEPGDRAGYWDFAGQLASWADNSHGDVKLCVSSRPYTEFQDTFSPSSPDRGRKQIHLHKLNRPEIERHCQQTFLNAQKEVPKIFSQLPRDYFTREIALRAEGVFLWAVLVVRILISEAKRGGSRIDLERKLKEIPDDMDELYNKMLNSLRPSNRQFSNRLLLVVLTNPFRQNVRALCLKRLVSKDLWQSRIPDNYTLGEAISEIKYIRQNLDVLTQGLVEVDEPPGLPADLLWTRVKLFHRTARDYLLNSRLSQLQSGFADFASESIHVTLRLKELAVFERTDRRVLFDSAGVDGYEMLETTTNADLGILENQIGGFQLTKPSVRELARIFPTFCSVPVFRGLVIEAPFRNNMVTKTRRTSYNHLAASLALDYDEVTQGFSRERSESDSGSLLLSACLSGIYFGGLPLVGRVPSLDLITTLIKNGFTANAVLRTSHPPGPLDLSHDWGDEGDEGEPISVWLVLLSGLSALDRFENRDPNKIAQLVDVLGELLHNERQEEVLFLGSNTFDESFKWFITLEDLIRVSGVKQARALDELRCWPKYEGGGPNSENAPTWIWDWNKSTTGYEIAANLAKLTTGDFQGRHDLFILAVVSRKYFVMGDLKVRYVKLW